MYEGWCEWCDEEGEENYYPYELGHSLAGACHLFDVLTPIPTCMDEFICRYVRALDTSIRLDRETVMLRTLGGEITKECYTLRIELEETCT